MSTPLPGGVCTGHLIVGGPAGDRVVDLGLKAVTLGREPGAGGITLTGVDVWRRHAALMPLPRGGPRIVDLGSTNGLSVNGVRVPAATLRPFDRVSIGAHSLLYVGPEEPADLLLQLASLIATPARGPRGEPAAGVRSAPVAWLDCVLLASIPLRPGVVTLGRGPGCDHVLPHESISRQHAAVSVSSDGEQLTFEDFSSNGSLLNGAPVIAGTRLRPGDRLTAGPFEFKVRVSVVGYPST